MALEKIKPRVVDETGNYTFNNVTATGTLVSANANLGNLATANYVSTDHLLYANGVPWSIGTGSVVGSNTQVQFNDDNGAFGASSNFTFNKGTNTLTVTNITANGAALTSLTGANVTGTVANATYATSAGSATTATNAGTVTTNAQPNITSVGSLSSLTVTGNLVSGNADLGNSTSSNYYLGNGYFLSSVSGGNVLGQVAYAGTANSVAGSNVVGAVTYASTANAVAGGNVMGQVGNALLAGTVYTNAQPNITSVGTLSSLSVTGNVSANYFLGDGSQLTGITIAGAYSNTNVAAYLPTYTNNVAWAITSNYANTANAVTGANVSGQVGNALLAGVVYTNAQPNITSVGTLSSLVVTGNVTGGNLVTGGKVYASDIVSGGTGIYFADGPSGYINFFTSTGDKVSIKDNGNIDVVGTANVGSLLTSGNITGGNANLGNSVTANFFNGNGYYLTGIQASGITGSYGNSNVTSYLPTHTGNVSANYFIGNGSTLTNITGANITGNAPFAGTANYANTANSVSGTNVSGQVGNALLASTVYTNAQPNITSVGTLTSLNVSGNAVLGNLTVTGTTTTVNSTTTQVVDPIFEIGGGANGAALSTDDNKDRGLLLHYYSGGVVDAFMGWDDSNGEFGFGSNVSVSSEVVTWNSYANVRSNYFIGNGSQLTSLTGSSIVGNAPFAGTANYANTANSVTGTNVTGNVSSANVAYYANITSNSTNAGSFFIPFVSGTGNSALQIDTTANDLTYQPSSGNLTAAYHVGNGYYLTGITATASLPISAGTSNINIASGGNATVSIGGTANILVVSSSGLTVAGNVDVSTNYFKGNGYYLTGVDSAGKVSNGSSNLNIATNSGNISMGVGGTPNVVIVSSSGINIAGTANITGIISSNSNMTVGSAGYFVGNGYYLTGIGGAGYIFNGTSNANIGTSSGNFTVSVNGTANVVVVSNTGINLQYTTSSAANLGNLVTANYVSGNGNLLTSLTGENVTGQVGNALLAGTVYTNAQPNITSVGTLTDLTVNGLTDLGTIANISIGGGAADYYLKTDGAGNLTWSAVSGGGGGGASLTYTTDNHPPATGNLLGDQWFNTTTSVLYEYISDGTASYWVDISSPTTTTTVPTTLDLANVSIAGGSNGQALVSNGAGGLSFANTFLQTTAPASNTAVGTPGQMAYSNGNLFVCVSANTWAKFSGTTSW